jgi:hypothetical protein
MSDLLIALIMLAAHTSETSVDNYFTRQYIPEDKSELHIRRRENLKSHIFMIVFFIYFDFLWPHSRIPINPIQS